MCVMTKEYTEELFMTMGKVLKFGDLSREGESSEQFVWYGERKAQLRCWAMRPSIQADWSQDEVI